MFGLRCITCSPDNWRKCYSANTETALTCSADKQIKTFWHSHHVIISIHTCRSIFTVPICIWCDRLNTRKGKRMVCKDLLLRYVANHWIWTPITYFTCWNLKVVNMWCYIKLCTMQDDDVFKWVKSWVQFCSKIIFFLQNGRIFMLLCNSQFFTM